MDYAKNELESINNPVISPSNFSRRPPPAPIYHPARNNNFDMSKTVSSIVDNWEADLAKHVKRRPSGQFESYPHPLLAAALMEDKKHPAKPMMSDLKYIKNYIYKKKHSSESNKFSNSPSISPSYSYSVSRSPSPMEHRNSNNKTNSRSPSPKFRPSFEFGQNRKLPAVPLNNPRQLFQNEMIVTKTNKGTKPNEEHYLIHPMKQQLPNDKNFNNQSKYEYENSPIYEEDDSDQNEVWF